MHKRYIFLIALSGISLLTSAYYALSLYTRPRHYDVLPQSSLQKAAAFKARQKNRLRRLNKCQQLPVTEWKANSRFWIHPLCRYAAIFFSEDEPSRLMPIGKPPSLAAKVQEQMGVTAEETIRRQQDPQNPLDIGMDLMRIWVQSPDTLGVLDFLLGSDFKDQHWPSIVVIDGFTGLKYLWDAPKPTGPDGKNHSEKKNDPEGEANGHPPSQVDKRNDEGLGAVSWLQALKGGRLKPYQKNELLESMPVEGGSDVELAPMDINGVFFDRYLANRTARQSLKEKEWFVTFHAPWCGHCRRFLAQYEPAVKAIVQRTKRQIGFYKLDVTANDVADPAFRITRVPTTLWFDRVHDSFVELRERTHVVEGLHTFLHQHSSVQLAPDNEL
ncbi:thioredoxin domain protein [Gregarina niphandrodes]|uniref:protein disulfide-isomerase n=1 Tax=Gregarina niphandrodes TaxID=110365 RepID=A0A023BD87_GRENI|nr:thioredoxin domain protein [Gregarina niphandrodes]EZG88153.1 thioredoxin domain protein [Gregarina niphandrodes]|eukprot:XP_011128620.1 thioredoxin domain protein [Gregarina niphandrodes]